MKKVYITSCSKVVRIVYNVVVEQRNNGEFPSHTIVATFDNEREAKEFVMDSLLEVQEKVEEQNGDNYLLTMGKKCEGFIFYTDDGNSFIQYFVSPFRFLEE